MAGRIADVWLASAGCALSSQTSRMTGARENDVSGLVRDARIGLSVTAV
jgi:hypothetical protein